MAVSEETLGLFNVSLNFFLLFGLKY